MLPILYTSLIVFIALFELVRYKQIKFDYLTFFNVVFCISYPLPALILSATAKNNLISSMLLGTTIDLNNVQVPLAIFLTYFLVTIGFYSKSSQRFAETIRLENKYKDRDRDSVNSVMLS